MWYIVVYMDTLLFSLFLDQLIPNLFINLFIYFIVYKILQGKTMSKDEPLLWSIIFNFFLFLYSTQFSPHKPYLVILLLESARNQLQSPS